MATGQEWIDKIGEMDTIVLEDLYISFKDISNNFPMVMQEFTGLDMILYFINNELKLRKHNINGNVM